jgi:GNAT superfamily N-acetyltransferase
MNLRYEEITEADLPEIANVMKRSFDDDTKRHLGKETGGPDGYDNGDFFRKWLFGYKETQGYKVLSDGKIIAAYIVWIFPHGNNILGTIFVDPDHQNEGYGLEIWKHIEESYPETKSWNLETPGFAKKNHFFYEKKCGFTKDENRSNSQDFYYKKRM